MQRYLRKGLLRAAVAAAAAVLVAQLGVPMSNEAHADQPSGAGPALIGTVSTAHGTRDVYDTRKLRATSGVTVVRESAGGTTTHSSSADANGRAGDLVADGDLVAYTSSWDFGYYTSEESDCIVGEPLTTWYAEVEGEGTWTDGAHLTNVAQAFWMGP